ncbi:unnamed protein product [Staurois parvus]|uniref:Uncharacterized protein n=1 Tax=Staurois parvus TaxID=386267 RepID=A0ABN9FV48_9NEOB|nr:unnamed protein product [Staurois parvus]
MGSQYGLPLLLPGPRNLPWAPVPTPHAAARPSVSWVPVRGLPLLLSLSPHSAMCHFQVSSHCWWFPFLS